MQRNAHYLKPLFYRDKMINYIHFLYNTCQKGSLSQKKTSTSIICLWKKFQVDQKVFCMLANNPKSLLKDSQLNR